MKRRLPQLKPEAIREAIGSWVQERVDLEPLQHFMAKKTVPRHRLSGIYLLGGAALFLFVVQVVTGCLLMLYYHPAEETAYASVKRIMEEVPYGWLFRSMHVWGANLFVVLVVLHFLTVLLTRGYRKPRELTWVAGSVLLFMTLGMGFSGYLLPWNELSYYATLVGTEIPGTFPVIGEWIVHLLRGGDQVSGDTITRFFAVHVMVLPLTIGAFLAVHLALLQVQGLSLPLGLNTKHVKDEEPFFTEFALLDASVWCILLGAVLTLAVLCPAEIGVEADPLKPAPVGIKPEWYFLFMFQTLKHVPEFWGVSFFTLVAVILVVLPFLDRKAQREQHSLGLTVVFAAFLIYAAAFEIWAFVLPGVEHPPEHLEAATYDRAHAIVSLVFAWLIIGSIVFLLHWLRAETKRVRRLYQAPSDIDDGSGEHS